MQGSYKHRAYPFENEGTLISRNDKKNKKRQMVKSHRRMEKINIEKIKREEDWEGFEEPDLGYEYIM